MARGKVEPIKHQLTEALTDEEEGFALDSESPVGDGVLDIESVRSWMITLVMPNDLSGNTYAGTTLFDEIAAVNLMGTSTEEELELPVSATLHQNYPNPFKSGDHHTF